MCKRLSTKSNSIFCYLTFLPKIYISIFLTSIHFQNNFDLFELGIH